MLTFTCNSCGNEADGQDFEYYFDFKTSELYVICNNCGTKEFATKFVKE